MKVTKYGASWCSPCKTIEDYLKTLKIDFTSVDIDKSPEIWEEKNSNTIPILDIFDDTERLLGTITGCPDSASELWDKINKILGNER